MATKRLNLSKDELRRDLLAKRAVRLAKSTTATRAQQSESLAATVLANESVARAVAAAANDATGDVATTIASYLPLPSEPDPTALHAALQERGIRVLVPECVTDDDGEPTLAWIELSGATMTAPSELSRDARGIPIPKGSRVGVGAGGLSAANCSILIMPALAASNSGARLGKGAGYYDRLLAAAASHGDQLTTIAAVFATELFETIPTEPHDASVSAVVVC